MKTSRYLPALAAALVLFAAPSLLSAAETDDTLRPLIVRPTANTDSSSAVASPAAAPAPAAPEAAPTALTPPATQTSEAKLKLPPPPASNKVNVNTPPPLRRPAPASGRDIFANFGPPSGSVVSDRVFQLRDEAITLRQAVDTNSDEFSQLRGRGAAGAIQYHSTVAAITARLEAGTTRGNPILVRQWSEAEQSLSEVNYSISKLNMMSSSLAGNSSTASYLLQAIKAAYELSGALDEDHGQLTMIRDEVAKSTVQIDRMRVDINEDIHRQNTYLATERNNLQTLAVSINRGELIHNSLANKSVMVDPEAISLPGTQMDEMCCSGMQQSAAPPPEPAPALPVQKTPINKAKSATYNRPVVDAPSQPDNSPGQLLVLVRFNQPDVEYEPQLHQAISSALDQKPDADFTVVAVTPKSGDTAAMGAETEEAQRHADSVKSSLVQLGLQPGRISTSNTSSEMADTPEVHVYIR